MLKNIVLAATVFSAVESFAVESSPDGKPSAMHARQLRANARSLSTRRGGNGASPAVDAHSHGQKKSAEKPVGRAGRGAQPRSADQTNSLSLDSDLLHEASKQAKIRLAQQQGSAATAGGSRGRSVAHSHPELGEHYEGDMKLTEEQRAYIEGGGSRGQRGVAYHFATRWTAGAAVPYTIASSTNAQSKIDIENAMKHIEDKTCVRFVQRTQEADYLSFFSGDGCWSWIGRTGGEQEVSVDAGCGFGAAVHEIGHALGLVHEQSRADRDDYVTVHEENVEEGRMSQFSKYSASDVDHLTDYDLGSIMHYPDWGFSKNGLPTITTNDPANQGLIGNRQGLTISDRKSFNILGGCDASYGLKQDGEICVEGVSCGDCENGHEYWYSHSTTACGSEPFNSHWVGDGYCDYGVYNTAEHNWDGGDCCQSTCTSGSYSCGSNGFECKGPPPPNPHWIGDGYCDGPAYNNEANNWDGGDCCMDTCTSGRAYECGTAGYNCLA